MKLFLDEGLHVKIYLRIFPYYNFTVTGFFTFSYFATGEYDGAGIIYTTVPFLS